MAERIATIDTSVLLSLQCTGMIGAVSVLFTRLLVPVAVRRELEADEARNYAALRALDEYQIFDSCDDYDLASVEFLLQERRYRGVGRDQGEAEAVAQASQRSAQMVLVDDAQGRNWAKGMALEFHGTLWIFEQLRALEYVTNLRPHFEKLLRNHRRQPRGVMNESLRKYDEPEIAEDEFRRLVSEGTTS
jgi:predicted nucleic acid-binding protein